MGAVAVGVESRDLCDATLEREVWSHHDVALAELCDGCDPGVDQGDVDALAGVAGGPEFIGSDLSGDVEQLRGLAGRLVGVG